MTDIPDCVTAGTATPPRRPGSVRRTTTHDCTRPEGLHGPVTIVARGRDLFTRDDDDAEVLDTARLHVRAQFASGIIDWITVDPPHFELAALRGVNALRGFRALVDKAMPAERDCGSVRYQLLDDLPTALMLSGRALRAAGLGLNIDSRRLPIDICAGWAAGSTLLAGLTDQGPPLHVGPVAPAVTPNDDALAWHDLDTLSPHSTRRSRRLDIWEDGVVQVDCFFRDSFADADGVETVVHQYTVRGTVDPATSRFVSCAADAGPLPYPECPAAAASARRLEGRTVDGLRRVVRVDFVGPSTCTHLNDTLRSLQDVGGLLHGLREASR
jgi:Protein of unknown function (DUF2889)